MIIVCPFNRPERLEHVLRMWRHQYTKADLVLIANERGSWCELAESASASVLVGTRSIGGARNVGLEYARSVGADWAVFWDDDNYYGGFYTREVERNITQEVDALSLGIGFVRWDSELLCFETPLSFCPGHSTAVRVSAAPRFPDISLGEDVEWSKGLDWTRVKHLGPWHLVYERSGTGHAYGADKTEFMATFGQARRIGEVADDFVDLPRSLSRFPVTTVEDEDVFTLLSNI